MNSTTTRVAVLAGGTALVLAVVWFLALFQPESHHLKAARAERAAAEAKAQTLNAEVVSLEALEKQAPQDKAALAVLQQAVPNTPDLSDALGQLHNAATASGVQLTSVSPTPPPTSASAAPATGGPSPLTVNLSVTGTYQQVVAFMTSLDHMARTVVLTTVNINSGVSGGLSASLTAEIFYANPPNANATPTGASSH